MLCVNEIIANRPDGVVALRAFTKRSLEVGGLYGATSAKCSAGNLEVGGASGSAIPPPGHQRDGRRSQEGVRRAKGGLEMGEDCQTAIEEMLNQEGGKWRRRRLHTHP